MGYKCCPFQIGQWAFSWAKFHLSSNFSIANCTASSLPLDPLTEGASTYNRDSFCIEAKFHGDRRRWLNLSRSGLSMITTAW